MMKWPNPKIDPRVVIQEAPHLRCESFPPPADQQCRVWTHGPGISGCFDAHFIGLQRFIKQEQTHDFSGFGSPRYTVYNEYKFRSFEVEVEMFHFRDNSRTDALSRVRIGNTFYPPPDACREYIVECACGSATTLYISRQNACHFAEPGDDYFKPKFCPACGRGPITAEEIISRVSFEVDKEEEHACDT